MSDKRRLPHNLREPNRSCVRCDEPFYGTTTTMCVPCRKAERRGSPMPPAKGGRPQDFLLTPPVIRSKPTKSYAEYLREAKPSKHEVVPRWRQTETPADVRAAIERVRQAEQGTSRYVRAHPVRR